MKKTLIVDEKLLRKRMIDLGVKNMGDLAAKSDVSKPTIYEFLNGKSPLSSSFLRLCEFLEVDPSELLVETDTEEDNV